MALLSVYPRSFLAEVTVLDGLLCYAQLVSAVLELNGSTCLRVRSNEVALVINSLGDLESTRLDEGQDNL